MSSIRISQLWRLSAVRQTLWLLILFSTISLFAWGGTYLLVQHEMTKAIDQRLSERVRRAVEDVQAKRPFQEPGVGQTVVLTSDEWSIGFQSIDIEDGDGPDMRYLVVATPQGNLVLGESIEREEDLITLLAAGMQITLFFTLIASLVFSLLIARRSQRRLNTINDVLKQVAMGHLTSRIHLDGDDDLSLLAKRIDNTTERLSRTMEHMRTQSSVIAHDLRTPLARLRTHIELRLEDFLQKRKPIVRQDLEDALEQIDDIGEIFDALLRLSQIESSVSREKFEILELSEFATLVRDTYAPVVADAGQEFHVDLNSPGSIAADPKLLMQLMANLVQNAMRHAKDGKKIKLTVQGTTLLVEDSGPGIPQSEREHVLQPMFQRKPGLQTKGHGLGLATVKAIADLHDAEMSLDFVQNEIGLQVCIRFPEATSV